MRFAAAAADDVANSQSVHLVVVSPEYHLGSEEAVAVLVVGTVLELFLVHPPEIDGVTSNGDHEAGDSFVTESKFVRDAGVWVHCWCVEETHDVIEPKRRGALSYVIPPLSFLLDTSQDREDWCIVLFRGLVEGR